MKTKNLIVGKAGEFRVASELLLREHEVFLPITDYGVDLILGNGKRLQIKTAFLGRNKWYSFSLKAWYKVGEPHKVHSLQGVDYIICWAINDNAFFIIPASYVRGRSVIAINPSSSNAHIQGRQHISQFIAFKNNWEVLK